MGVNICGDLDEEKVVSSNEIISESFITNSQETSRKPKPKKKKISEVFFEISKLKNGDTIKIKSINYKIKKILDNSGNGNEIYKVKKSVKKFSEIKDLELFINCNSFIGLKKKNFNDLFGYILSDLWVVFQKKKKKEREKGNFFVLSNFFFSNVFLAISEDGETKICVSCNSNCNLCFKKANWGDCNNVYFIKNFLDDSLEISFYNYFYKNKDGEKGKEKEGNLKEKKYNLFGIKKIERNNNDFLNHFQIVFLKSISSKKYLTTSQNGTSINGNGENNDLAKWIVFKKDSNIILLENFKFKEKFLQINDFGGCKLGKKGENCEFHCFKFSDEYEKEKIVISLCSVKHLNFHLGITKSGKRKNGTQTSRNQLDSHFELTINEN